MLEIKHLKTIAAIADQGSLVMAAEKLFLTQSALSHQIKEIESRLGVRLFIRKSRPLRLTAAGERILETARSVLPLMTATERDLERFAGGQTGRLHIAIECHSCFDWLMPAINEYRNHWRDVELDLSTAFNFVPLPALQKGRLDAVITSEPQAIAGIHYEALFRFEILLAVANTHPLATTKNVSPEALRDETLITYPVDQQRLDIFTHFLNPADVQPLGVRTAELTLMMIQLVASGRGVCALPNWALAPYLAGGHVSALTLGEEGLHSTLYLALREEQHQAPYLREFVRIARETCFKTLKGISPA
ncbi:MAG: LysR family transcriptional regulator [Pseudomonadales bacterium]|nr:LysR family transcriptional regulator [Pseudomonadales bacterium]MCP5344066.1 LysR family transcriptional regulator [Pseudomonadales bacterium]